MLTSSFFFEPYLARMYHKEDIEILQEVFHKLTTRDVVAFPEPQRSKVPARHIQ
jgi:hypothetical protein